MVLYNAYPSDPAMKPPPFEYIAAESVEHTLELMEEHGDAAKLLAGGQSLIPAMNFRVLQPTVLIDLNRIEDLEYIQHADDGALVVGAMTRQRDLEKSQDVERVAPLLYEAMPHIAHPQIRTRGTIGGSLAHADPASDWTSCLAAIGAEVVLFGAAGRRTVAVADFMVGVFETVLAPDEIVEAVRVPRLSPGARFGFYKFCRKTGEFAHAIGAVLHDPERSVLRAVIGATDSTPIVLDDATELFGGDAARVSFDRAAAGRLLEERGLGDDPFARQVHLTALERAVERMHRA